jgi:hypothetical protein
MSDLPLHLQPSRLELEVQQGADYYFALPLEGRRALADIIRLDLGHYLSGPPGDGETAEQRAALAQMRQAEAFLGLDGELTKKQYATAQAALGLWDFNRVWRAFDSWDRAKQIYYGRSIAWVGQARGVRGGHPVKRRDALEAFKDWQRDRPGQRAYGEYDAYRLAKNKRMPSGDVLYPSARTVADRYVWDELLAGRKRVKPAAGAQALDWVAECTKRPWLLVGTGAIEALASACKHQPREIFRDAHFPTPVARFDRDRFWLASDVVAYFDGGQVPERAPYELQELYVDAVQLAPLLGVRRDMATKLRQRPAAYGKASRLSYWLRTEVEAWVAANADIIADRKRLRSERRAVLERPQTELEALLVAATYVWREYRVRIDPDDPAAPKAAFEFIDRHAYRYYLRSDVRAYARGEEFPRRQPDFLRADYCGIEEVAALIGRLPVTLQQRKDLYPMPPSAGRLGLKVMWARVDAERWAAEWLRRAGGAQSRLSRSAVAGVRALHDHR